MIKWITDRIRKRAHSSPANWMAWARESHWLRRAQSCMDLARYANSVMPGPGWNDLIYLAPVVQWLDSAITNTIYRILNYYQNLQIYLVDSSFCDDDSEIKYSFVRGRTKDLSFRCDKWGGHPGWNWFIIPLLCTSKWNKTNTINHWKRAGKGASQM